MNWRSHSYICSLQKSHKFFHLRDAVCALRHSKIQMQSSCPRLVYVNGWDARRMSMCKTHQA